MIVCHWASDIKVRRLDVANVSVPTLLTLIYFYVRVFELYEHKQARPSCQTLLPTFIKVSSRVSHHDTCVTYQNGESTNEPSLSDPLVIAPIEILTYENLAHVIDVEAEDWHSIVDGVPDATTSVHVDEAGNCVPNPLLEEYVI